MQNQSQLSREELVALVEKLYYAHISMSKTRYDNTKKILQEIFQKVLNRTT